MKVILWRTTYKDMVFIILQMEKGMLEIEKKIKCMEGESFNGQMEDVIKGSLWMIRNKGLEY